MKRTTHSTAAKSGGPYPLDRRRRATRPSPRAPGALLAALLVGLTTTAARPRAQVPPRSVPSPQEFVTTQDDSLFSLSRSQDDIHFWEQAISELAEGANEAAVERLHRLLDRESGGIVSVGPDRFLALRHAVVMTLANLSPAANAAYEALVAREAGELLDQPLHQLRIDQLESLADRFPAARIGQRARLRLGDLCLERGDGVAAAGHYRVALAGVAIQSKLERAIGERLACAEALTQPRTVRARSARPAVVDDLLAAVPDQGAAPDWRAFGGGAAGTRPMTAPVGQPAPYFEDDAVAPGFDYGGGGGYAMHPVGGLEAIYLNTGFELQAIDPLRRELHWESPAPMRDQDLRGGSEVLRAVNQSMILSAALCDEVVVAPLQVPAPGNAVRYQNAFTIIQPIPERRLFAFQRSNGKLLWAHYDRMDGPFTRRFDGHASSGPPLVVGDTVYAPTHDRTGAIAFYLSAYDLRTGDEKWRRLICSSQQEVNMFGNARMEFAASPLCADGGLIYGCSNLGVCYAVEMATGRLRWIASYEVIKMPATQLRNQEARPVYFQNSAPVVVDNVLCVTPLDSAHVVGIDCETGVQLWRMPHEARAAGNNYVRWLFGAIDDEFMLAGRGVVAVKARPEQPTGGDAVVRQVRAGEHLRSDIRGEQARPAIADGLIYFPSSAGVSVFDADGKLSPASGTLRTQTPGNLVLTGGIIVSTASRSFEVLLDTQAMQKRAESDLELRPDDPAAILRLCTLRRALWGDDPRGDAALEQLYRRGLEVCRAQGLQPENPLRATFQRQLFEITIQRASQLSGKDAIRTLREAAELAPDDFMYLRAESQLLIELRVDTRALLAELDALERRAGTMVYPLPGADAPVPVAAYVLWQRAQLLGDPGQRIANWQRLLEEHPEATLRGRSIGRLADEAIAALIDKHGRAVYAPIEARATAAMQQAGSDTAALRAVSTHYPHSVAAGEARRRLLDAAVSSGDLASATEVFAVATRGQSPSPGLLRRVLEAARLRGNFGLARGVARRLAAIGDQPSDWPADQGASYADVARGLLPQLAAAAAAPAQNQLPVERLAEIPNSNARHGFRYLKTSAAEGFGAPADTPFYVAVDDKVKAYDLRAQPPLLFERQTGWIAGVWVLGRTLVIPSMSQLTAVDYRTGEVQWQRQAGAAMFDCLGVVEGVLIVTREGGTRDDVQLLGIEPLSGKTLYVQPLALGDNEPQAKATETDVLVLRTRNEGDPVVERIDPLTGDTRAAFPLTEELRGRLGLRPQMLRSRLFPQFLSANDELLFVPLDGHLGDGDRPRIAAVRQDGAIAWMWEGTPGRHLWMPALRGDRMVAVERVTPGGSRVAILDAGTGNQLREVELGEDLQLLNWRRETSSTPAPAALLCTDMTVDGQDRRLVCVGIDAGYPTFQQSIGNADEVVRSPWVDRQHMVYALRPRLGGKLRMFALQLRDRSGAFPDGDKFRWLPVAATGLQECEITTVGPYTVVVTDSKLSVFGDSLERR